MKKFWMWLLPIISLINFGAEALYISKMPEGQYPLHWNINMEVDRYGSKWTLLIPCVACILIGIGYPIYRYCTRNNEDIQKNGKYELFCIIPTMILTIALGWVILGNVNTRLIERYLPVSCCVFFGVLFILMANVMGKVRQNRYFGIKIKSTLSNQTVWKKAHRLCGKLGVLGGFVMLAAAVASFFIEKPAVLGWTMLSALLVSVCLFGVIPTIYANRLYKQLGDDGCSVLSSKAE